MKNIRLTVILLLIIVFLIAGYFFILQFRKSGPTPSISPSPTSSLSPTNSLPPAASASPTATKGTPTTQTSTPPCTNDQLAATIAAQGGAGNIFGTLELTNTGATTCSVVLGNTIIETTPATNVTVHYQQTATTQVFVLKPHAKAYSQVHYPNGPQCSSGVTPQPITFLYKSDQTAVPFQSTAPQTGTLMIQACTSQTEKTVVDIWPLSQSPITP